MAEASAPKKRAAPEAEEDIYLRGDFDAFEVASAVDIQALSDRIDRIAFLGQPRRRRLVFEYLRFLALKIAAGKAGAEALSPSPSIDFVWHQHVLDTARYADECQAICGYTVRHDPDGGADAAARERRYRLTLASYRRFFKTEPPAEVWPESAVAAEEDDAKRRRPESIQVFVKGLSGNLKTVRVDANAPVADLHFAVQTVTGVPADQQRLLFGGTQLDQVPRTIADYKIGKESTVNLVLRLTGC